jgi:hypothetical protein
VESTSAPNALGGEILPPGAHPLKPDDPAAIGGHRLAGRLSPRGVYLARDPAGTFVVVKSGREPRRLRTEAACARRLPGSCTPRLLTDGTEEEPAYLVSEYVEGPSLKQFVEDVGPLDPRRLRALAAALARALATVHDARLIHGDLRPANVLLAADGPRLLDFGMAQEIPAPGSPAEYGPMPDDPSWVAPERLAGDPAGPASDVFGWGCLIVYAATGHGPYETAGIGVPRRDPDLSALDEPIRRLATTALATNPADRPPAGHIASHLTRRAQLTPEDRPALHAREEHGGAALTPRLASDAATTPIPRIGPGMEPPAAPRPTGRTPGTPAAALSRERTPGAAPSPAHHTPGAAAARLPAEPAPGTPTAPAPTDRASGAPAASHRMPGAPVAPVRTDRASGAPASAAPAPAAPAAPAPKDRIPAAAASPGTERIRDAAGHTAIAAAFASGAVSDPPRVLVDTSPERWPDEDARRPRRLRAFALVSVPVAVVAVIAAVVAVTGRSTGGQETVPGSVPVVPPGTEAPGSPAPSAPSLRSAGPHPASVSDTPDTPGATPPSRHSGHVRTTTAHPTHAPGSHSPSSHPTTRPPTSTPSPTPTPTGTGGTSPSG